MGDALCRTEAPQMLSSNANCTQVIRRAEATLNTTVFLPGESCADSHLLVCTQLVQPLMSSLLIPGFGLLVALVATAFLWPLLDRELAQSFEDTLAVVVQKEGA